MKRALFILMLILTVGVQAVERQKLNFNSGWRLQVGDVAEAEKPEFDDSQWQRVTLPYAFNGDEAFRKDIVDLTDTVCWYRKTFTLTEADVAGKVFIEFEGARQGADVFLNGQKVGFSDNGVMAFGFDLTPYIREGENVLAVRCDNSWTYRDRVLNSRYQWNDKNFNANYGGLPKNVWLHLTGKLCLRTYQVDSGQELVGCQDVAHVWANLLAELRQDADDLTALFSFQLANLVVGLYHLGGLDEYRTTRCRLVVHNTLDFSLQAWCNRNHQTAVAHRGCDVFVDDALALRGSENRIECA